MALSGECEEHGWSWDPADDMGCPVCYGIEITEERIIKLLEEHTMRMTNPMDNTVVEGLRITPSKLIALIEGEGENK